MKVLAIETSTDAASCALWLNGQILERRCPTAVNSSETLLPTLADLLAEAGLPLSRLDGIAFGAGPGSFTGLRVACGVAQGLAFAHDLPVAPVCTLAAMAQASGESSVLALLDARMKEVYFAAYVQVAGYAELRGEIRVAPPEAIPEPAGGEWVVCGNALTAYPALSARFGDTFRLRPELIPTAASIAVLGQRELAAGCGMAPELAAPLYIRDKVAQTVAERLAAGGKA